MKPSLMAAVEGLSFVVICNSAAADDYIDTVRNDDHRCTFANDL